jgi:hypothetical protein
MSVLIKIRFRFDTNFSEFYELHEFSLKNKFNELHCYLK